MAGLLYKDFISIKGKKLTVTYMVIFAVIIIMRLLLPLVFLQIENDNDIEMADMLADGLYWSAGMLLFFMIFGTVTSGWPAKLVEDDKTRGKVIDYYSSLPVKKNQYIASHYILIGIMAYAVFSFTIIWYIVGSSLSKAERFAPLWSVTFPLVLSYVLFGIVCAAIDLGSFISLGTSKGKVVKIAMFMLLGTAVLWFVFFGDVESIKNMDMKMFVNWMVAHQFELSLVEVIGPFVSLAVYYLSYRISCHFCDKGAY